MQDKTFLSQVKGFTPVIDALAAELGFMTALVYGIVWRYCQGKDRVCEASKETIAGHVDISDKTVQRHLQKLCKAGYLRDLTPDRRNAPHIYADTGQAQIIGLVEARIGRTESPTKQKPGETQSPTGQDRESYPGRTESPVKKEEKDRKEREEKESPPADYLSDIHAHIDKSNNAGVASPDEDPAAWLHYREEALKIYHELTGLHPDSKVARPAIAALAGGPDFDPARWRASVESCVLAGVRPRNVACMLDVYEHGGDYRAMLRGDKKPNGKQNWYTDEELAAFGPVPSERPAPDPVEMLWSAALVDLSTQMPRSVYHAHLANSRVERDNGTLRVFVSPRSAEWLNNSWLPRIIDAVRAVDASVERVEVGT